MLIAIKNRILQKLLDEKHIEESKLADLLLEEEQSGQSLDRLLVEKGGLTERDVLLAFSQGLGIPFVETLSDFSVPDDFVSSVPILLARNYNIVGLQRDNGTLRVATCHPLDLQAIDEISNLTRAEIETVLAPRSEITKLLNRAYQRSNPGVDQSIDEIDQNDDMAGLATQVEASEDILEMVNKAPVIKLVNSILFGALQERASDVHIQPFEDKVQIRYRIDGILYDKSPLPKRVQDAVISRIKIMGKMDIAEKRLPQDGGAVIHVGHAEVDLRISSIPTSHGERIVFRLLDRSARVYKLPEIGFTGHNLDKVLSLIHLHHGIFLVTGPTGSGKTTTLFAALSELSADEKNILTIEDPIEYKLQGISQIEVSEKKGLTFAAGLRSIMRQDPDVILVGEIRDLETATIGIQSALTGHMVFSTLHTNDAASAVTRLVDLGIEPYLVASSVVAVMAQRLVRLNCVYCKESFVPHTKDLEDIGLKVTDLRDGLLYRGTGCEKCFDRCYMDRTGIYELFLVSDRIREQIMSSDSAANIKATAIKQGMKTMRQDGASKVIEGQTTIDEVVRVTQMDVL